MPWMVSIDALEYDLLALEKELLRRDCFESQKLLREFFAPAREGWYVDDVSKLQRCSLCAFKSDGIVPDSRVVRSFGGGLCCKGKS